jgi:hypothetical protein
MMTVYELLAEALRNAGVIVTPTVLQQVMDDAGLRLVGTAKRSVREHLEQHGQLSLP